MGEVNRAIFFCETTQLASILWLRQLYGLELYHDYFEISEVEGAVS
jgi:hypothetical protein